MTEADLLAETLRLTEKHNVLAFHDYTPLKNPPGFPDLVLVGLYRHGFRELKSYRGAPGSPAQTTWRWMLKCSADYDIWYPIDLESGAIETYLMWLNTPSVSKP
jgi:hypothetical protein